MDVETGLINMKGRLYDPRIARFMQADPIMQAPFWSQGLNRYSYVFNNPLQWVDPSGFEGVPEGDDIPAGATVVGTTQEGSCGAGDCRPGDIEYSAPAADAKPETTAESQTQDETAKGSGDATGESAQAGTDPEVSQQQDPVEVNEFESEALYGPPTLDEWLDTQEDSPEASAASSSAPPSHPKGGMIDVLKDPAFKGDPDAAEFWDDTLGIAAIFAPGPGYGWGLFGKLAARGAPSAFKAFTRANFRENLARLTGGIPKGAQAHHVLPQKFASLFEKAGLNISDPKFGAWWERGAHQQAASAYNQAWQEFLSSNPSQAQILEFGREIAGRYGLSIGF